ncbi:MAG: hypothetical protein M0P69_19370 [Bacteroidales bacterium]|nr:hypothetical protein [Bacteroidales bacterium]
MVKKTFSVYVDDDKVKRARDCGFELSTTLDRSLDMVLSQEFEDILVGSKLSIFDQRIDDIKLAMIECKCRLDAYNRDLEDLTKERTVLLKDYEYTKKVIRINNLMQSLNQIIIIQDYDIKTVLEFASDIVEELQKVNPAFTVEDQIARLKIIMGS